MTREEAAKLLPIIKAFSEGKIIQTSIKDGPWVDLDNDIEFYTNDRYKVKLSPTYRPFKDAEECWNEMQKHQPFGWVKSTLHGDYTLVQRVTTLYVEINRDIIDYKDTMRDYTFADGQPFGVKEE